MARFQNPGALFLGTLVAQEQKFLKPLLENAKKSGYSKVVEPCAGAFAMSHLAAQVGYSGSQIEASDVSMFTSIMGYAIMGKTLEELEIKAEGFTDEELCDPATALYAQLVLRTAKQAGKDYFYNILLDLQHRRTKAFLGQKSEHFPHLTHLPWSIVGASKPDCDSAPTGHTFTAGHLWFCGQFSFFKVSFFSITLFSSIFVVLICGSFRSFFRTRGGADMPAFSSISRCCGFVNSKCVGCFPDIAV